MAQDQQKPQNQDQDSSNAQENVLPPDLLEEAQALEKKVDILSQALTTVIKDKTK